MKELNPTNVGKTQRDVVKLSSVHPIKTPLFFVAFALLLLGLSISYYYFKSTKILIADIVVFFVCLAFLRHTLCSKIYNASILGDSLVLKNYNNKGVVTSIGSVRKIKKRSLLNHQFTTITYRLDGSSRTATFLARKPLVTEHYSIIDNVRCDYKSKKANL